MDPLHMDVLVLDDLQQLYTDTGCRLEDIPEAMDDRNE